MNTWLSLKPGRLLFIVLGLMMYEAGLPAFTTRAADDGDVVIGVRSYVDERWEGVRKRGPIEHGKVYLIASLNEAPSPKPLLRPVNQDSLMDSVRGTLNAHGFRQAMSDDTPDVVLTVVYGRGFVRNPYLGNVDGDVSASSVIPTAAESNLAAAIDPSLPGKRRWNSYEQKVIAAQTEKLFLRITAWAYPGENQGSPKELWKTTMVVDEPDKADPNLLYPKMLAAGAAFFDRPMSNEEAVIRSSLKEGIVKVGPLEVVESQEPAMGPDIRATTK